MTKNTFGGERLSFIDAIRALAILMMLQGHFVAGLLSDEYRVLDNPLFMAWRYLRGLTAPVFFTISGFIFTLLLERHRGKGWGNPRLKKGLFRGLKLIVIGYLLQLRLLWLLQGAINPTFNIVHVLQSIGLSLILIVLLYWITDRLKKEFLGILLLGITVLLFSYQSVYVNWDYDHFPEIISNYFTRKNGSVFTIVPWFGFASFGGFLALAFSGRFTHTMFYKKSILWMVPVGTILLLRSYEGIQYLKNLTHFHIFEAALPNSYLFARLGTILLLFAFFMLVQRYVKSGIILKIGENTLPIYVLHSIILYGSITGLGLTRWFYHSLSGTTVLIAAPIFVFGVSWAAIWSLRKWSILKKLF